MPSKPCKVLYFGCSNSDTGHYLWQYPWHRATKPFEHEVFGYLDGAYLPQTKYGSITSKEGDCYLHHKEGWTLIAFTDQTKDERPGSNSCFLIDKVVGYEEGLALAQEQWPTLFERFKEAGMELKLYEGS